MLTGAGGVRFIAAGLCRRPDAVWLSGSETAPRTGSPERLQDAAPSPTTPGGASTGRRNRGDEHDAG